MAASSDFRRVTASLSWTLVGEVLFAAGQFGMLIAMSHLGSSEALGRYALGLAIATPLFIITSLHLRPTYVVNEDKRFAFGHYFALRLLGAIMAVALAAIWSAAAGHEPQTFWMVVLVSATRFSELISDICHAAAGRAERLRRVGIARATRGVLLLVATAGGLWIGWQPHLAVGLGAVVGLVVTLVYDVPTAAALVSVRPIFAPRELWKLAGVASWVGLAGGLLGLTMNTPAYLLEADSGVEAIAPYAAVISVVFVSGVLNAAIGSAAVPRLARLFDADRPAFVRLLRRIVALVAAAGVSIMLGCMLVGDTYLAVAYGAQYAHLQQHLVAAGGIVLASGIANMLSQTLVAMRYFKLQFAINAATFVLGGTLGLALIPGAGLEGALMALGAIAVARLLIYSVTIVVLSRRGTGSL